MTLISKITSALATLLLGATVGCSSAEKKIEYPKAMFPVNIAAGYFGAVATHEAGHALAAKAAGVEHVNIDILPVRKDGEQHYGYTKYGGVWLTGADRTMFNVSGPLAMYVGNIATREALKTGYVPNAVQPTLQWYSLFNKSLTYAEAIEGIARAKHTDLGKERVGIALGFLAAGLAYDIYDLGTDKGPFFKVLAGQEFYEPEKKKTTLSLQTDSDSVGLFVSKRF